MATIVPVPNDDRITRVGQVNDSDVTVRVVAVCHLAHVVNRVEVLSINCFVVVGLVTVPIELVVLAQVEDTQELGIRRVGNVPDPKGQRIVIRIERVRDAVEDYRDVALERRAVDSCGDGIAMRMSVLAVAVGGSAEFLEAA